MSEMELNAELLEALDRLSQLKDESAESDSADAEQRQSDLDRIEADAKLVKRCVAGEVAAWEEIYDQCHRPLMRSIQCILGAEHSDPNLVDELAARVWYALVADDGKLLARFDRNRGARLGTFLRCIAKDVASRYFRSEYRRRRRERAVGKQRPVKRRASRDADPAMSELVDTLTPSEQEFLDQYLLNDDPTDGSSREYSSANAWKLASRIRQKIKEFFRPDPNDG